MKLIHFSHTEILKLEETEQEENSRKPCGLWISDEDDYGWSQWCKENDDFDGYWEYIYEVTLKTDDILFLSCKEEISHLVPAFNSELIPYFSNEFSEYMANFIPDWKAMTKYYDGIIITPHHWGSCGTLWYSGWDCASGCIWNPKSIELNRLEVEVKV